MKRTKQEKAVALLTKCFSRMSNEEIIAVIHIGNEVLRLRKEKKENEV